MNAEAELEDWETSEDAAHWPPAEDWVDDTRWWKEMAA